jgi:hypothetical protein
MYGLAVLLSISRRNTIKNIDKVANAPLQTVEPSADITFLQIKVIKSLGKCGARREV